MSAFVLPIESAAATLSSVGGKGANLAELIRAGFPVPGGFLITTDAYRAFVAANRIAEQVLALAQAVTPDDPLALEQTSDEIRALFARGQVPPEIAAEVAAAYAGLSHGAPPAVAVRSSATAEDLPGLSFAGQQDTYLNIVGADALLDATRRCWASLWTARAIGYRARNGIPSDEVALAVVVQALIPSEVSGVLFTANPLSGRRDEIVIDASFGLGEAIVSGQVEPDHYVVDPRTWRISGRKLGAKALAIIPRAGGGTEEVARTDARQALPDEQIIELARTARRVTDHFGTPQDIEWAWAGGRMYLLQSRPITSLYPLPDLPSWVKGTRVYWSFNSVQGVVDPFTPLGRDAMRMVAAGIFRFLHIERPPREVLTDAGGRLFVDVTDATAVMRVVLGRVDPGAQQALERLIAEGSVMSIQPFTRGRLWTLLPNLLPGIGRVLAAALGPEYTRARLIVEAERFLAEAHQHATAARTPAALLASMEADLGQAVPRLISKVLPVLVLGIGAMFVIDGLLADWLGLKPGSALQLMRGLAGNVTTEMDLQLWAVAETIRADIAARDTLLAEPVEAQVEAYRRGTLPATAQRALEQFMGQYGMRGVAEIDIGRQRWRDDPAPILQIIHGYLQQEDPDLAPDALFRRGAAEADRLAAEWVADARRTRFGVIRARLLGGAIRRMRALAGLRELPKFTIIRVFGAYRNALVAIGEGLVSFGALDHAEDIFFVPIDPLRRALQGQAVDLRAIVAAERSTYERELERRPMPRLMLSTGETFYDGMSADGAAADFVGSGVSPGVVEGPARVVRDPRGVRLKPGEILVCPATDPGWTPLFLTAGGLVMELGGLVTHGSVVAREYGIPAVVGVHEATTRIVDGQRIRVDGTQGWVVLLDAVAEPAMAG